MNESMEESSPDGEYTFECPYCFEEISIPIDYTAGREQSFIYDCEVCCRPIAIQLEISAGEITGFSAEPS